MNILDIQKQPYFLLEGSEGLNITDSEIREYLHSSNYEYYLFDNLYEKREKLACINFLEPKTLIFGTTGLFKDKLKDVFDLVYELNLNSVENIIFTLEPNRSIYMFLNPILTKYKKIKLFNYLEDGEIEEIK